MTLDLHAFKKALTSLENGVAVALKKEKEDGIDVLEMNLIMAGVIQNFEFTYELCWKFMKRWLEANISYEAVDGVSRKELFRIAAENRLIDDISKWIDFHQARNKTSHIYDEDVAEKVYVITKEFLPEAKVLLQRIEAKND